MTVFLIYVSANLILAVVKMTLKTDKDCTVSSKQVIIMKHLTKVFVSVQKWNYISLKK